jgi:hypothetical protein
MLPYAAVFCGKESPVGGREGEGAKERRGGGGGRGAGVAGGSGGSGRCRKEIESSVESWGGGGRGRHALGGSRGGGRGCHALGGGNAHMSSWERAEERLLQQASAKY